MENKKLLIFSKQKSFALKNVSGVSIWDVIELREIKARKLLEWFQAKRKKALPLPIASRSVN